ncbi:MAG: hypothetical protein GH144_10375 [Clostridia bacterium]|jgi:hypothetical protein|nr:hypothetical protein [Clostridia bacterium]
MKRKYLLLPLAALILALPGCRTITQPAPSAPSNLAGIAVSSSEINLTWKDNSPDETGFYIYRKTTDNYSKVGVMEANATSYNNTGLNPETTYTYKVTAYNDGGESSPSNEVTVTTLSEPEDGLVAYIEGRIPPGDWFHWGTLGTSNSTLYLELRGTGSKERSEAEIVRFEWIFGDGDTAEGEYTNHTYHTGDWYIALAVYDQQGNSVSETLKIEVRGTEPQIQPIIDSVTDGLGHINTNSWAKGTGGDWPGGLTSSPTIYIGDVLTCTINVSNSSGLSYKFDYAPPGTGFKTIQDWSNLNVCTWIVPTDAFGQYAIIMLQVHNNDGLNYLGFCDDYTYMTYVVLSQ